MRLTLRTCLYQRTCTEVCHLLHPLCMLLMLLWKSIKAGQEEKRTRRMSFLICPFSCPCGSVLVSCLLLGHLMPLGSLGGIYSAMEGRRRRRRAHGASFTITWKFQPRSRIRRTLYPAPGLIPAVPRESWSVTEQINVYCFLSILDHPMLTAEAVILPATVEYGMMVHHRSLRICELHQ